MVQWPNCLGLDQVVVPRGGAIIVIEGYEDREPAKVTHAYAGMPLTQFVAAACTSMTLKPVCSESIEPIESAMEEGDVLRIKVRVNQ